MKIHWQPLLALYLLSSPSFAGQGKQPHGEVTDADGLLKVHTFCLDTSQLTPHQLSDLRTFTVSADKAKGVFAKLHWQHLEGCGTADATVKLSMEETERLGPAGDGTPLQNTSGALIAVKLQRAKILVTNRASGKALYQAESGEFTDDREGAFGGAFSKLLKVLKTLSK
jgi:hypothetical protein